MNKKKTNVLTSFEQLGDVLIPQEVKQSPDGSETNFKSGIDPYDGGESRICEIDEYGLMEKVSAKDAFETVKRASLLAKQKRRY